MNGLSSLIACAGSWQGTNQLQDPNTDTPEVSPSNLTVTPVLEGSFVRIDYSWVYQGAPQEGSLLVGYQPKAAVFTAHWADTWHMSNKVMACQGTAEAASIIAVRGSYAAPPEPDWGWRIVIDLEDSRAIHVVMHNLSPAGQAYLAVEAQYSRSEKAL